MKNKNLTLSFILILALTARPLLTGAQSFESVKKQYPDQQAVLLSKTQHYTISIKDGQPYVESRDVQQIEYLTAQASAYLSQYSFYNSDFQQVVAYEAYTQTARDKKLKVNAFKTSSSMDDFVFYDDVKETTFDFPSVGEGAVGNLEVSRINKNPHLLNPFYFASYVPVINSELKISAPKDMVIRYRLMGTDTAKVELNIEKKRHENIYTFRFPNCPAEKRYGDAPDQPWYATHVIFYIDSYQDETGNRIRYLSNLDDLYQLNYSFTKTINTGLQPELKYIVDSLTAGSSSLSERAKRIYSWVQHQIKYVAFEQGMEGFIPRDANLVCKRRFGDCKDMSSILTTMMKAAGIPAYYKWIGTRNLPYAFSDLPLPLVSNHMICTIRVDDQYIFLDGTDPTCIFGFPSAGIQEKEAMISISEKEYKILKVPAISKKENTLTDSTWLELTDQGIEGRIKKIFTGYFSMHQKGKLQYSNKADLKDEIKNECSRGSNKFILDSFQIEAVPGQDSAALTASFRLPDYARKLGPDWYLNLNLFKFYEHEEIDYPKRKIPIAYNFKYRRSYVTLLKIPEGYKVDYLPKGKSYHNAVWGFDLQYEQKGNLLILTQEFDNDHLMLEPDQFALWNKVLENLFPLYKETLSLTKI